MNLSFIKPSVEILTPYDEIRQYPKRIEAAGRTCYRSQDRVGAETDEKFCRMLIRRGHESVLEHCQLSVRIVCDRATSHQIVRHRLCAYSQESQRFVDYQDSLEVIRPPVFIEGHEKYDEIATKDWEEAVLDAAVKYKTLRSRGIKPEDARSVLPNCSSTRIVMTTNLRQWRWIFLERACNHRAQYQFRTLMLSLLTELHTLVPCLFSDLFEIAQEKGTTNKESFICGYEK